MAELRITGIHSHVYGLANCDPVVLLIVNVLH